MPSFTKGTVFTARRIWSATSLGGVAVEIGQRGEVLVAAEAAADAAVADDAADDATRLTDDVGAEEVAVRVVDLLDAVHVHDEQRDGLFRDARGVEQRRELRVELAAHEQARKVVDVEQPLDGFVEIDLERVFLLERDGRGAEDDAIVRLAAGIRPCDSPFTVVPLVLPRSNRAQPSPRSSMRAWCHEII